MLVKHLFDKRNLLSAEECRNFLTCSGKTPNSTQCAGEEKMIKNFINKFIT